VAKDIRLDVVSSADNKGLLSAALMMEADAEAADKLGDQFRQAARDGGILAVELEAVKIKSAELARQFNDTGDKALLRQISRNQSYERQLQRVGKELDKVGQSAEGEAHKLGHDLANDTSKGFADFFGTQKGFLSVLFTPQGLAAAAAAATVGGVMIGGALLAGIGAAGIGAGIAAEFKTPAVANAFAQLKDTFVNTFKDAAAPFIAPTIAAFHDLGQMIQTDLAPGLKSMFTELAPEIGGLVHGFGKFVVEVAGGFEKAAIAAKPLLNVLGSELLPGLGKDIAALFTTIAHNAPEAEKGLKLLFMAIEFGIGITNVAINVFSKLFDYFTSTFEGGVLLADKFIGAMLAVEKALHLPHDDLDAAKSALDGFLGDVDDFRTNSDALPNGFGVAAAAASLFATKTNTADQAVKDLNKSWTDLDNALTADQGLIDAKNQIAGIKDQLDKHSKSLDINTQAGRDNRSALENSIQSLERDRDALIKNGMSASDANKKFQGWVKQLEAGAEKAGVSKTAIQKLNEQLGLLPKSKTINVSIKIRKTGDANITGTGIKFFAAGGRYQAGVPRVVGEDGPEFDIPDHSGVIVPNKAVASAMPGSGSASSAGGAMTVSFDTNGDQLVQAILAALRPVIRGQYRGNVSAALGGAR